MEALQSDHHMSQPDQLIRVGITESILLRAISAGASRFAECTMNHPAIVPGVYFWGDTVATLAEELIVVGWEKFERNNLPIILSPDRSIGLIVASGDERTGNPLYQPVKRKSGPRTSELVASNRVQQLGLTEVGFLARSSESNIEWETWVLLCYRDDAKRVIRSECSRPVGFNGDLKAAKWDDRWILPSLSIDPDVDAFQEERDQREPDIDVEVTWKR